MSTAWIDLAAKEREEKELILKYCKAILEYGESFDRIEMSYYGDEVFIESLERKDDTFGKTLVVNLKRCKD